MFSATMSAETRALCKKFMQAPCLALDKLAVHFTLPLVGKGFPTQCLHILYMFPIDTPVPFFLAVSCFYPERTFTLVFSSQSIYSI